MGEGKGGMARGKEETSNSESTLPRLGREVEGPNCRSEADDNELKEKHDDLEVELDNLKSWTI